MLNDRSNLKRNKIHLKCLTSLRFFAVMLIVFHHLRLEFRPPLLKSSNFENGGIIGVTFFLLYFYKYLVPMGLDKILVTSW